jgi:hypothetical protein
MATLHRRRKVGQDFVMPLRLILSVVLLAHEGTTVGGAQASHTDRQYTTPSPGGAILTRTVITDLSLITVTSDYRFVGREVALTDVLVDRVGPYGFWISTPNSRDQVLVIPAEGPLISARGGDHVSIHGEVRQMSDALRRLLYLTYAWDEHIHVYAFTVRPTGGYGEATRQTRRDEVTRPDPRLVTLE